MRRLAVAFATFSTLLSYAGPLSQFGGRGFGGLSITGEPTVQLRRVEADMHVDTNGLAAVLRYHLASPRSPRLVQVSFPAVAGVVESDGDAAPASPWQDAKVFVDGKSVDHGLVVDQGARGDLGCSAVIAGMPDSPASTHAVRARLRVPGEGTAVVELRFRAPWMHDDWRASDGRIERSMRRLCLRLRALPGMAGTATGSVRAKVDLAGGIVATVSGLEPVDGGWELRRDDVDLKAISDVVVELPAPAEANAP